VKHRRWGYKVTNRDASLRSDCYDVTAAALADDKKPTLEGASGISAPEVVEHSAENLRNTGSDLHAK
jgi:hypothetical protein